MKFRRRFISYYGDVASCSVRRVSISGDIFVGNACGLHDRVLVEQDPSLGLVRYPVVQIRAKSFLLILFQTGEDKSLTLTFCCGSAAEKVLIEFSFLYDVIPRGFIVFGFL